MAALITANTCPACASVHGQGGDWPTCPHHRHLMYLLCADDNGWTYACQARYPRPCKYTHTQKEKATMTTANETARAALAIRDGQDMWDAKQLAALTQLGVENAPKADLAVFLHRCQATGLDPFAGQISMVRRGGRYVIQTGIDGYRVVAHRAAKREGVELSYGPTKWYDAAHGEHAIWLGDEPPAGASVTVYKNRQMFPGVARFNSFAARGKDGQLLAQWATMPDHMIAKCAEAQALRKAVPHDLDNVYTSDEDAHIAAVAQAAPPVAVQQAPAWPQEEPERYARAVPRIQRGDVEGLWKAIAAQFDAIDIVDTDERDNWVCKLANKDPEKGVQILSERDLRFALDSLATCADLEALVELCAPEPAAP